MAQSSQSAQLTRLMLAGFVTGAAAYILGFLVTYVWLGSAVEERLRGFNVLAQLLGGTPVPTWKGVAWLFYNAHFVATRVPGLGGPRSVNFIAQADGGNITALYLVPPVLLVLGGAMVAAGMRVRAPVQGAFAGTTVTLGYVLPAFAVAFASAYAVGSGNVSPDMVTATLLAGLAYPVGFGLLGGGVAGFLA